MHAGIIVSEGGPKYPGITVLTARWPTTKTFWLNNDVIIVLCRNGIVIITSNYLFNYMPVCPNMVLGHPWAPCTLQYVATSFRHIQDVVIAFCVICSYYVNITSSTPCARPTKHISIEFDENSERSSFKYVRPITTIFCTRHDSDTIVTCTKYRCDRPRIFYTRVFWIFIEFRIRSKYA